MLLFQSCLTPASPCSLSSSSDAPRLENRQNSPVMRDISLFHPSFPQGRKSHLQVKLSVGERVCGEEAARDEAAKRPEIVTLSAAQWEALHGLDGQNAAVLRHSADRTFEESRTSGLGGGEGGIRTLGTLARSTVFETAPFDHSGTSPHEKARGARGPGRVESAAVSGPPGACQVPCWLRRWMTMARCLSDRCEALYFPL